LDSQITSDNSWKKTSLGSHFHARSGFFLFQQFLEQAIIRRYGISIAGRLHRLSRFGRRGRDGIDILTAFTPGFFPGIFINDPILMAALRAFESNHYFSLSL
jgi:hypothetical protein